MICNAFDLSKSHIYLVGGFTLRRLANLNRVCLVGQAHRDWTLFSLAHVRQAATLAAGGVELAF